MLIFIAAQATYACLVDRALFLLQKSHEIIYIGRDRPGQLHSLYQASCAVGTCTVMISWRADMHADE